MIERVFVEEEGVDWLGELNHEQRLATASPPRPLLILAGAGTGKTATLSARVAWLISEGVAPERILLLTFTRRAAREMLTRTRALLERAGVAAAGSVVGGTFHSVAWRLVRLYAEPLGLPPRLSVLDASDSGDLLDVVRQELGYAESGRRFPRKGPPLGTGAPRRRGSSIAACTTAATRSRRGRSPAGCSCSTWRGSWARRSRRSTRPTGICCPTARSTCAGSSTTTT
jgi:UvrD/REP helicase N-terminal domain